MTDVINVEMCADDDFDVLRPHSKLPQLSEDAGRLFGRGIRAIRIYGHSRVDQSRHRTTSEIAGSNAKMVGGPGFEPGASRSRTLRISCPPVSRRFRQCPPVLNFDGRCVLLCPSVSSWFRECVTHL